MKSGIALGAAAGLLERLSLGAGEPAKSWRAAIIGDTGHGNYGHEHDLIFNDRPNIEVVAVADPDAEGRARAARRCHAARTYADYNAMLGKEKPGLVCVAPRWTNQHHAMGRAALAAGAHLYMEKPFTQTLAEADDLLKRARAADLKIAVAHQMRLAPGIQFLQRRLKEGAFGELLELRAHGKQDSRAGGEDLIVLGTHLFDLMRFLAGDALWCTARVLQSGHEVTRADARKATEDIGPIAGDDIEAQFGFADGVHGSFTSRARARQTMGHWGIEIICSKARLRILADIWPNIFILQSSDWSESGRADRWVRLENDPGPGMPGPERGFRAANKRVVDDWLESIAEGREPACSGYNAMKSLEMIMAIFAAGLSRARVSLPLVSREHPLAMA